MCDFLISFGPIDTASAAAALRDRPGMANAPVETFTFPWGTALVQAPRGRGYRPHESGDELFCCVARPRFTGVTHEDRGEDGFGRIFAERWRQGGPKAMFDGLTGMYALLRCAADGVDVLTDQMGFQPVYRTARGDDGVVLLGTHVEILARIAGRESDFDPVSLGELLVHNYVTFPFTSRNGIEELSPAGLHRFPFDGTRATTRTFWEPAENDAGLTDAEAIDAVEYAVREAVEDVIRGCPGVAVTLSGGMDSRTLLATLPAPNRAAALTYMSRRNREVDVAAEIARTCGVQHVLVQRSDAYYTDVLLDRGPRLLGVERRAMAHGFCVVDNGLQSAFDLVLGGQLSDTFLKDHFMPKWMKESLRPKGWPERAKRAVKRLLGANGQPAPVNPASTVGRHLLEVHLLDEIRTAVRERRGRRLQQIAEIRPRTAEEWSRFWPTSRQDDLAHVSGNMKLFAFDSPFMHRAIVETSCKLSPHQRYGGRIAHAAFGRLYGSALGRILNANTALPADAAGAGKGHRKNRRRSRPSPETASMATASAAPWNDVQGSWVDLRLLQTHEPTWQARREALTRSSALPTLSGVLGERARAALEGYQDDLPPGLNAMIVQMATAITNVAEDVETLATSDAR